MELRRHRNPARAPAEKAYLKSDLEFLGVGLPAMRQIVREVKRQHGGLDRQRLVALVKVLWKSSVFERRIFGARCRCGRARIDRVLRSLKREELSDLRDTSGRVVVKCEFCSTEYAYDDGDLDRIYASAA